MNCLEIFSQMLHNYLMGHVLIWLQNYYFSCVSMHKRFSNITFSINATKSTNAVS